MQPLRHKPNRPYFSSGPCAKRPGWNVDVLRDMDIGRSHRSKGSKAKLNKVIEKTRELLAIPEDYLVGIVPGSDTGAVELAMWNFLGPRPVDVLVWESFSKDWAIDAKELGLKDFRVLDADYGELPDLKQVEQERDVVFVYNGTTSGVRLENLKWLNKKREGLTICDATSAAFAMEMDWSKLDVTTFSWQKVLGSEGAHGMLILSPKAVERLEKSPPKRALPKIFRILKKGKINKSIFEGATINTPSMLAVEDALDALKWVENAGGAVGTTKRSNNNLNIVKNWIAEHDWIEFLAKDPKTISNTSICLKITDPKFTKLSKEKQGEKLKEILNYLAEERVAYDIASYRDAPLGIRIWGGATVEANDIAILLQWLEFAYKKFL
jgi:phosphoserine aminotransferase